MKTWHLLHVGSKSNLHCQINLHSLKINMLISILFIIPFIYQLKVFYSYYDGHLFGSRQRISYICLITSICKEKAFNLIFIPVVLMITYSLTNIEALYFITAFFLQILFFQFMGYLITKISKLTSGWVIVVYAIFP